MFFRRVSANRDSKFYTVGYFRYLNFSR